MLLITYNMKFDISNIYVWTTCKCMLLSFVRGMAWPNFRHWKLHTSRPTDSYRKSHITVQILAGTGVQQLGLWWLRPCNHIWPIKPTLWWIYYMHYTFASIMLYALHAFNWIWQYRKFNRIALRHYARRYISVLRYGDAHWIAVVPQKRKKAA